MLLPLSLCALAVHQETAAEPPAAPPLTPQLVVRVPDVPAAWRALQDSPWARLLQDEAILAVLREQWGEPDLTLQSLWSNGVEQGRVGEDLLGALELLAGLRSATIGIAVRPGSIDAPRNEWQPAEMLLGGQVALVLDVDDEGSIPRWRAALDGYFGRPDVRARLGEAGTAWTVEGTRAVLRVGDLSRVLPIDALVTDGSTGAPGGEASRLPDATGGVLADVWVAPFHELHLFESAPFGIALARLLGLLVGPQAGFVAGSGRMRVSISNGMVAIDEVRELLPPESGDFLGRTPVAREAIGLAHPEAWLATIASVDRDALEAALEESFGEATSSEFVGLVGDSLAISVPPIRGIAQIPPVFVTARHTDPDAMTRVVARMAERAIAVSGGAAVLERREYRGSEFFTFEAAPEIVPPEMQMIANLLRPTIAVTEDRIVVTTAPVAMKKEVRRLRKDDATHIGLAGITAPEGATSLSFVDWGSAALSANSMLMSIARMSGAIDEEDDAGASLAGLPWPDLIRRHFPSGFRWSVAADGVRITRSEASMDALDAMLVVAGGAIFMMFDKAVAEVELAQTQLALVEGAVQDYLLEHLKCPPTLEAAYPGSAPPLDPWGRPFVYQPLEGFEFEVRSAGPNGIDEGGEGDDITRDG
ncbi:MAG: type II secretion system protein GspG [Planctomycetota bacterium]